MSKRDTTKTELYRECKKSVSSYISRQKFLKDSMRRRDSMREMIADIENQLIILKNAETALSAQIEKISPHLSEERKVYYERNH
ncbi:MAG: hypothetical protein J1F60_02025 [Oscillospiraceae bacterium]|nr:hypothetical protein [Oscillospiraceae bacterium]